MALMSGECRHRIPSLEGGRVQRDRTGDERKSKEAFPVGSWIHVHGTPNVREPKWYDPNAENPPWIKALAEASIVAIDQYAEAALGNRDFFLNRPYSIDGGVRDNVP